MRENKLTGKYIDITNLIQTEFNRNFQKWGDKIKCKKGCSQCCSQIFNITAFDGYIIKNHLNSMHENEKKILMEKAKHYIGTIKLDGNTSDEFFMKPKLECPALSESGECTIYEARPVICRRFGPPVYDYKNPEKLFACELNFNNGEEIIDDDLIPNQTVIGKEWDTLKTKFNMEFDLKENASTTIAEAILSS